MSELEHRAVIAGIGRSVIGRSVDRSGLQLALDAILAAIEDSGCSVDDIDGLATFPGASVELVPGTVGPDMYDVQDALGLELNWHLGMSQGGGQIAPLVQAVLAIAAGLCRHVVVFRACTESSSQRGAGRGGIGASMSTIPGPLGRLVTAGALSGANFAALYARRYMDQFGVTEEQLGWVPISARNHAARNPAAVYSQPLSMDDYLSARLISDPLRLFDCDVPVDGAVAIVVSDSTTVSDLRHPIRIEAVGGALRNRPLIDQRDDVTTMASDDAAAQMWGRTTLKHSDVDVAQLYDGFSIFTLLWLEALGFCGRGEAGDFVDGGRTISLDGALPLNTWGGQLSGGRLHGYGFVYEAVQQLRGEADRRQVEGAEVAIVGVGAWHMAGALLLTQ